MMDVKAALSHSEDWHAERRKGLGGSDAKKVMDGDWLELWEQKTGRTEGDNLDDILAVQMGTWTEPLNRYWFTRETGKQITTEDCDHITNTKHTFMRANLDGLIVTEAAVFEAKHTGQYTKDEEFVSRYYPQCQHLLAVTGLPLVYLSGFFGNSRWAYFEIASDAEYQAGLIAREAEFWGYVERDEAPPSAVESQAIAIALDDMREMDMAGNNAWASGAADWTENIGGAKVFKAAEKILKELVEADVKLATGHGVKIARSKNGALRISEVK